MTSTRVRAALAVLLFVSFPLVATLAEPADSHEADSAAIKKLFTDFNNAFNNHDAHAAAMLFTEDADFITIQGATIRGRAKIEQQMAPLFAGRLKTAHRDVSLRDIHFLRPDTATVDSDYRDERADGSGRRSSSSGKGPVRLDRDEAERPLADRRLARVEYSGIPTTASPIIFARTSARVATCDPGLLRDN